MKKLIWIKASNSTPLLPNPFWIPCFGKSIKTGTLSMNTMMLLTIKVGIISGNIFFIKDLITLWTAITFELKKPRCILKKNGVARLLLVLQIFMQ